MRPDKEALMEKHRLHALGLRRCFSCTQILPIDQFGVAKGGFAGLQPNCKPCTNERNRTVYSQTEQYKHLKREAQRRRRALSGPLTPEENRRNNLWKHYKMTLEDYGFQLDVQGGRCAICRTEDPGTRTGVFVVDHCHAAGHVRSLLCQPCNIGLGGFRDNPDALRAAAKYLEEHAA